MGSKVFSKTSRYATVVLALTVAVAVALSGCGSGATQKKTQKTLKVGQALTVSLPSPTTGYKWQLAQPLNPKVLKKVGSSYQALPASKGKVSAGGVELWTFIGVGKGTDDVTMQYVGPSKGAKPAQEKVFSVTVN